MTSQLSSFIRRLTLDTLNWGWSADDQPMVEALLDMGHVVILSTSADAGITGIAAIVEDANLAYDVATIYTPNCFVVFPNGLGIRGRNNAKKIGRKDFIALAMIKLDGAE